MPNTYVSLPTFSDEEHQECLLVKSTEDNKSFNAETISSKVWFMAYILFGLTILLSITSVGAGVHLLRTQQASSAPIDTLPRPNIFVGLPKDPKIHHAHIHDHTHSA
ncbi:hypothetical protein CPB83DRAFT_861708 [Crepidotus variabilis]|uniref:Uncharacterized protein n=1 Tax=Crepidotus variabilis TaxID=179855 RepID=A0A9P6E801_9AGAR|nr:hypothetical protein CPB83DRAFT_861708 [Crepidotus variabilis]